MHTGISYRFLPWFEPSRLFLPNFFGSSTDALLDIFANNCHIFVIESSIDLVHTIQGRRLENVECKNETQRTESFLTARQLRHLFPTFVFRANLKHDTFRERIQLVDRFKISISTVSDQTVDWFHVLCDKQKSVFEFIETFCSQILMLLSSPRQIFFSQAQLFLFLGKFMSFFLINLQDWNVWICGFHFLSHNGDFFVNNLLLLGKESNLFVFKGVCYFCMLQVVLISCNSRWFTISNQRLLWQNWGSRSSRFGTFLLRLSYRRLARSPPILDLNFVIFLRSLHIVVRIGF